MSNEVRLQAIRDVVLHSVGVMLGMDPYASTFTEAEIFRHVRWLEKDAAMRARAVAVMERKAVESDRDSLGWMAAYGEEAFKAMRRRAFYAEERIAELEAKVAEALARNIELG